MEPNAVTVEDTTPNRALAVAQRDDAPECSAFECNICYDVAESPVVTMCGHLYCWPCLYRCVPSMPTMFSLIATSPGPVRCLACTSQQPFISSCLCRWMQVQAHCQVCPVCKAGIEQSKVSVQGPELFFPEDLESLNGILDTMPIDLHAVLLPVILFMIL